MHRFSGELFLGGDRLRNLDGMLDEQTDGEPDHWSGEFTTKRRELPLEIGRPYLLMLDDGRAHRVLLTQIDDRQSREIVVRFDETR